MNKEKLKILFEQCTDKQRAAKECGMTYQSMYNLLYKENTTCKVESIERIAKFFDKKVGYFFDEEADQNAVASGDNSVAAIQSTVTQGDCAVLQERIAGLEEIIKEKERTITEKERTIQILMNKC